MISVTRLHKLLDDGQIGEDALLIDVRTPAEYNSGTIPGAVNMPLSDIEKHFDELNGYKKVYVHCQSGNRSGRACSALHALEGPDIVDVEGGIGAWEGEGFRVEKRKRMIPIIRQVHIVVALLGTLGLLLGYFVHPSWLLLTGLMMAGLAVHGLTGFCGMGILLAKAPWNN
jgi:rhodanese-related sulfurtransferase